MLLDRIHAEHPDWTKSTAPNTWSWMTMPYGSSAIWYGLLFSLKGPAIELYFGSPDAAVNAAEFERVLAHRATLEGLFGEPLEFDDLEGRKACRIRTYRPGGGDVLQKADWDGYLNWFLATMERFRYATQHVRGLNGGGD
jgi:hypothetical protein